MLTPEPPYPLHGGGAFRTASLVHYLARFSTPDIILISDKGQPSLLPPELHALQHVISLPQHSKTPASRYLRNARRALAGIPPLVDRLSGLESRIQTLTAGQRWDLGIIEHFWCAGYVSILQDVCHKLVLDLHNVESVLHERCAMYSSGLVKAGHRRFAGASRCMEAELLPRFSLVLVTSQQDADAVLRIAPSARVQVYPNAFPDRGWPGDGSFPASEPRGGPPQVVFSGNFEYHPNIDAVEFLVGDVWPRLRSLEPDLRLRLVGRGDESIRHLLRPGIDATGPVEDAFREIAAADVVVAPLRIGSGTRLKIIEAWSAGRAVVATPLAAEGLDARDGENILLARDAAGIAAAVSRLLRDRETRDRLGRAGRALFVDRYSWEAAWRTLDPNAQLMRSTALDGYTGTI